MRFSALAKFRISWEARLGEVDAQLLQREIGDASGLEERFQGKLSIFIVFCKR
jgi:hypothetical protein